MGDVWSYMALFHHPENAIEFQLMRMLTEKQDLAATDNARNEETSVTRE